MCITNIYRSEKLDKTWHFTPWNKQNLTGQLYNEAAKKGKFFFGAVLRAFFTPFLLPNVVG
jgi:hypothetical protein